MVAVALVGLGGSASTSGPSKNCQSISPWSYRHPMRMVSLAVSNTATVSLVKRTLKSAAQKGPIPTNELLKMGNM